MKDKKITISLNPTYLCNFRCHFCYLTPEQLGDKNKLNLSLLQGLLDQIKAAGYTVDHADLYGGEIGLLRNDYLEQMDQILYDHSDPTINVITNMSVKNLYFEQEHVDLSVSFDFEVRELSDKVLYNMMTSEKDIAVLMLASRELITKDVEEMIKVFNSIKNITSVEIKPYSSNQANRYEITDEEFESFVIKWINSPTSKNFEFINEKLIQESLNKTRNAFSDDHVYITPSGKFSILEFDENDHEFFLELDTFSEYVAWSEVEKNRVNKNAICKKCEYLGHCLTEHYRPVKSLEHSCNGFKNLLDYYKRLSVENGVGIS